MGAKYARRLYVAMINLDRDVAKAKRKLRKQVIRENFGQNEVRKLRGKYSDLSYPERMIAAEKINAFSNWCATYTGKE